MDKIQKSAIEPQPAQPSKGINFGAALAPLNWLMREAIMPALEKLIPQGAAELAQALFTEQSYVPYGPTEKPLEMTEDDQQSKHHEAREHWHAEAPRIQGKEVERG